MVRHIPKDVIIETFVQTIDVQSQGGMKVGNAEQGEKKKTPGGVFMFLIKKSPR